MTECGTPRDAVQRGVQGQSPYPEHPILLPVAGDTGLKVEPADGGSDIPRRITRECRRGGVHLEQNKPVHAPGVADRTAAQNKRVPPLTGVCMGFLRRGMASDLQVELGIRPGFGQQPYPVPEPAPVQQPPQPGDAVADYAYGPYRLLWATAVSGRQRPGRRAQVAWGNPAVMGVFHPGAIGQGQQCCHRQHQPVAGDARRVGAPGLVPLPAQAFDGLEAQFDPEAQGVPTGSGVLRRQVSEDDPRFFLLDVPDRQQGAAAVLRWGY